MAYTPNNDVVLFKNNSGRWGYISGKYVGPKDWATESYARKRLNDSGLKVVEVRR